MPTALLNLHGYPLISADELRASQEEVVRLMALIAPPADVQGESLTSSRDLASFEFAARKG